MFQLDKLLTPALTFCAVQGASKKRVIETASEKICAEHRELESAELYSNLLAREKLGSTALGEGIAIPHCRLSTCRSPVVALMTLQEPVDFDALDGAPVDILFFLTVPEEATQEHLNILAGLAQLLNEARFRDALRAAADRDALYRSAIEFEP